MLASLRRRVARQAIGLARMIGLGGAVEAIRMTARTITVVTTGGMRNGGRLGGRKGATGNPKSDCSEKK